MEAGTGHKPTLIPGSKGIFDVKVGPRLVFSKHQSGRHAEPGEVGKLVQAALE
ncbi:MAG: Rdx family protein [Verrucomicrobiales bacterium]|nr:Rdx family protein [Verrucomicrobiales bacterium]